MLYSSVWGEDSDTRIVWITLLLLKSPSDQVVRASMDGVAHAARVSLEKTRKALEKFKRPDALSRNQEHKGKRIEEVAGGWLVLNGELYSTMGNADARREYLRKKQAEHRAKVRGEGSGEGKGEGEGEKMTDEEMLKRAIE